MSETQVEAVAPQLERKSLFSRALGFSPVLMEQGIVSATSFFTGMLIGRFGHGTYEAYYTALQWTIFWEGIQEEVVDSPYVIHSRRFSSEESIWYSGSAFVGQLLISLLAVIGLLCFGTTLFFFDPNTTAYSTLWITASVIPFLLFRRHLRQRSFSKLLFSSALLLNGTLFLLHIGTLFTLVATGRLTGNLSFLVMGLSCAVACTLLCLIRPEKWKFDRLKFREHVALHWRLSKWLLLRAVFHYSLGAMFPVLLGYLADSQEVTIFGKVNQTLGILQVVSFAAANYVLAKNSRDFADGGVDSLRSNVNRSSKYVGLTIALLCLPLFFVGGWLVDLLYDCPDPSTYYVVLLAIPTFLMNSQIGIYGSASNVLGRPQVNVVADFSAFVVGMTALFFTGPEWKAIGASFSMCMAVLSSLFIRVVWLNWFGYRLKSN